MTYQLPFAQTLDLGTVPYVSGQQQTFDIPRNGVLVGLNLYAEFTITNSGTSPVGPLWMNAARLIRNLSIVIGGRDHVVSQRGESLAARAVYEMGGYFEGSGSLVTTAAAATVYRVVLPIPFYLPRSRTPLLTALDLRGVSQATALITFATDDCADFFGTPNGAALSSVTLSLEGQYLDNLGGNAAFLVRQLSEISDGVTATTQTQAETIDGATGLNVRSVAFAMLNSNQGSDSILNRLTLQSSSDVFSNRKGRAIQGMNQAMFGLGFFLPGYYYQGMPFSGDETLDLRSDKANLPADLKAILDVTSPGANGSLLASIEGVRPSKLAA